MKRNALLVLLTLATLLLASIDAGAQGRGRRGPAGAAASAPARPAEPTRLRQTKPPRLHPYMAVPMLRVETGGHVGPIHSMATDAANRYLVTGGADKTVRIWSLPDIEPLKTLRPPIGIGNEGRIDAVAISPDGSRVAAGGATCMSIDGSACIYIFDTASGRLIKRVRGFAAIIKALEWSPDGATLAVGMAGKAGLKLLRTDGWTEIGGDPDYGDPVGTMHFDGHGRLATGSVDGQIRLYSYDAQAITLKAKKTALDIKLPARQAATLRTGIPRAVRFSPDGSKLAVGQTGGANWLTVLSSDTLETLYLPTTGITLPQRGMNSIAWSTDGNTLYAATASLNPIPTVVRKWTDAGRGAYTDLPAGQEAVLSMLVLNDGGLAFSSADQILGRYDASGNKTAWIAPQTGQFHGGTESFKLSHDGSQVEFPYEAGGKSLLNFDLHSRKLGTGAIAGTAMKAAETSADELVFGDQWRDSMGGLKLGTRPLRFLPLERSRSLAIAPDRNSFVVGTRYALRHYNKMGGTLWNLFTPYDVYAVNISGDGRLVVAAFGDGAIRWFRRNNGRLLATLFVAPDRKRWLLASPTGFYDSSVGAEDFLGWHVNRGRDESADFFPASRLRARLYKPDVLAAILASGDDAQAFRLAAAALNSSAVTVVESAPEPESDTPDQAPVAEGEDGQAHESAVAQMVSDITQVLPPVVTVHSPASGSTVATTQITLRYSVKTAKDAPVTSVRTRVDGLAAASRNLVIASTDAGIREITVTIPPQDTEILVFAENKNGVSTPDRIKLKWIGAAKSAAAETKPTLYVLSVGVSQYKKQEYRLNFAAKDATDFANIVNQQKGKFYKDVVVKLLTDEKAGSKDVIAGFEWLQKQVTADDVGMVFIAGHGLNDERTGYYFMPVNADLDNLEGTGVPFDQIKGHLANLAGKGLLFVDTCHAGNVMGGGRKGWSTDVNGMLNELSSAEYGLVVLASSTGKQFSLENASWGNGAFTKALVEGLAGRADLKKRGRITHKMLDFYVSDRVDELTGGQQTPVNSSPQGVPDYTVAVAPN